VDPIEEIKQKINIVGLIGEYLPLKKAGINYKGCCPFHNEKTPSFFVSEERQNFHCFGCSEHGDIFTFLQKMEGLEFPEALKLLAQKSGVQLKEFDSRTSSIKNRLLDIVKLISEKWQADFQKDVGKKAFLYVKEKRGLTDSTIHDFKIGYAQDSWDSTFNFLKGKGFSENEIFTAGLVIKKEKGSDYYDRFRDRVIFPIQDIHGNTIGFTARAMKDDEMAKYINSPETPIYYKGRVIFGLDKAKQFIKKQGYAVVVEGNMDVIACHQAGFKNVVACSGTALTPDQITLLKRYTGNVLLCLDGDEAGQRATNRSIDLLYQQEMNIKVMTLVSGKDPDECLQNSKDDWVKSIQGGVHPMQYYINKYLTEEALSEVHKKKEAVKTLLTELVKISNSIERDYWLKELAVRLDVDTTVLNEAIGKVKKVKVAEPKKDANEVKREEKSIDQVNLERIVSIIINHPELIGYCQEYYTPEMIHIENLRELYKALIICYNEIEDKSKQELIKCLESKNLSIDKDYFSSLDIYISKIYENFSDADLQEELINLIKYQKISFFNSKIKALSSTMQIAEKNGNTDELVNIIKNIQSYSEQLSKLK
jgi:DNA primase